jgi:SAM-dependent methyltransferase
MQGVAACDSHYTPRHDGRAAAQNRCTRRPLLPLWRPCSGKSVNAGKLSFHYKYVALNDSSLLTDRRYLSDVHYRTQDNLAARQSLYAYQRSPIHLASAVIAAAGLAGSETVLDIGCGNGIYLAELVRRGHAGRMVGADLSAGMLAAARGAVLAAARGAGPAVAQGAGPAVAQGAGPAVAQGAGPAVAQGAGPAAGFVCGDAAAVPLADNVTDVTLAAHMLQHVPDRPAAVREFRRITRPGGQVLFVLNASGHLAELRDLVESSAADIGVPVGPIWVETRTDEDGLNLDSGAQLLAGQFAVVERHDFVGELVVPAPQPTLDYVASLRIVQSLASPEQLIAAVARRLPGGEFRIRTHCGALVCR